MPFTQFDLLPELLAALAEKGYTEPTQIQTQAIPLVLAGHDLLAQSQTGTGKTAGFVLPLLQRLLKKKEQGRVRALILTPTRELALQVEDNVKALGKNLPLKSLAVVGGVNSQMQNQRLRKGVDIVVATPGRLLDLVQQKTLSLAHVEIFVLDEADRMLDMGFIHDIRRIAKLLPTPRQSLLFSATFSEEIQKLAGEFLHAPKRLHIAQENPAAERVSQVVHPVDSSRKTELLSTLIKDNNWQQVLVFMRTKHGANRLAERLGSQGITATAIHGNKSQQARLQALQRFKKGLVRILVATDIASRGIDIDHLPFVVNYDLPHVPEDYIHRIGRTGRAGKAGEAVSLVCSDEHKLLIAIERLLKRKIPQVVIPHFEPRLAPQHKPAQTNKRKRPRIR